LREGAVASTDAAVPEAVTRFAYSMDGEVYERSIYDSREAAAKAGLRKAMLDDSHQFWTARLMAGWELIAASRARVAREAIATMQDVLAQWDMERKTDVEISATDAEQLGLAVAAAVREWPGLADFRYIVDVQRHMVG